MSIETTILDFKLSNTFKEYEAHMNAAEQQAMFKEMGVKTFLKEHLFSILYFLKIFLLNQTK